MNSTTERALMFPGLYLNNDVTCQNMRTRFCNLTIKDSKNVNLKVPAQNQKRRKLIAFKVDRSQKRLHRYVVFNVRHMYSNHTFLQISNDVIAKFEKIQLKTDREQRKFFYHTRLSYNVTLSL